MLTYCINSNHTLIGGYVKTFSTNLKIYFHRIKSMGYGSI